MHVCEHEETTELLAGPNHGRVLWYGSETEPQAVLILFLRSGWEELPQTLPDECIGWLAIR